MKRTFLRGLVMNAGGSGAVAAVALVRNVLIARTMGAAAFGVWQICLVALRLAGESHLGALHALALDAPVHRGAGREEEARRLERRCLTAALLLSSLAGLLAGAVLRIEGGPGLLPAAGLLVLAVVLQQAFLAHASILQTRRQFGRLALLQGAFAAVHLAGLLLLVPTRYVTGALLAWSAGVVAAVVLVRVVTRDPLPRPSAPEAGALAGVVRRGFATYLVGVTFVLLFQVDRVVVGSSLGREALGHYGVLLLGGSVLLFVPDVLTGVLWPFAGERYGRSGGSGASLAPVAASTVRALSLVLAAVLLVVLQGTEVLVARVLPTFRPALPALRLYAAGVYLLALYHPMRFLLATAGADRGILRVQVYVLLGAFLLESIASRSAGIRGVALASAIASGALLSLGLHLAAGVLGLGWRALRLGVEAAALLGAALAIDAGIGRMGFPAKTDAGAAMRLALPAAALLAAGIFVFRLRSRGAFPEGEPPGPGAG